MGNCQAVDAAALVIQHPNGRIDRMYWPISASEVMKTNPGHYVSLIIPLPDNSRGEISDDKTIRFTRVKLLRASDTLVLGRAYRLVTNQEVMKVLRAKKDAKLKKPQSESEEKLQRGLQNNKSSRHRTEAGESAADKNKNSQVMRHERQRQRPGSKNIAVIRSKSWRPSLQSITESRADDG